MTAGFPKPLPGAPRSAAWLLDNVGEAVIAVFGDPQTAFASVAAFDDATADSLVFYKHKKASAVAAVENCPAAVVVAGVAAPDRVTGCVLQVAEPTRWFVKALHLIFPPARAPGIHPSAVVSPGARLGDNVRIDAHAVVEDGVVIGANTQLGAGVLVAAGTRIGSDCMIGPHTVIGEHGLAMVGESDGSFLPFPHFGSVIIGDRVEIGANCCVVRGILKDTIIGNGVKMANQVNISHNCRIGDDCWISGRTIVCGSAVLDARVMVGAGSTINNHITIGAGARIGLGSVVVKPVAPGTGVFGVPAAPLPFMRPF